MDWIERLNKTLAYIETHLADEIDYGQLAKIACCSSYQFQRMFAYIANMPLPEYIRRRRMSLAAVELQSGEKIIDVALKYGYTSPTAFNRAFQVIHGIAPSQAKKSGAVLKSYPKINFKLIAKGVEEMEFRIEKHEEMRVLGVSAPLSEDVEKAYEQAEALWEKVLFEGAPQDKEGNPLDTGVLCNALNTAANVKYPDGGSIKYDGFFGIEVETEIEGEHGGGQYMIAVESPAPESDMLKAYTIPAHTWAIFKGSNFFAEEYNTAASAIAVEERIYSEWLPTSGYELAGNVRVHFLFATTDLTNAPFEIWLPVTRDARVSS